MWRIPRASTLRSGSCLRRLICTLQSHASCWDTIPSAEPDLRLKASRALALRKPADGLEFSAVRSGRPGGAIADVVQPPRISAFLDSSTSAPSSDEPARRLLGRTYGYRYNRSSFFGGVKLSENTKCRSSKS